jgi:integrase
MKGFIRPRGETFTAYWELRDVATGRRVQHSKGGFRTKTAAQKHLNVVVGKVQEGSWRPDQPLNVRSLLQDHWLPAQRARELRPSTLEGYAVAIDHWIIPHLGGLPVASLTPAAVVEFMAALRSEKSANGRNGLSARTVQLATGVLKSACAWAVQAEILGRNPIAGVRRPRAAAPVMKVWTSDEARRFLEATREDRLAFAWALLLARGVRRGELCGLKWSAVDLDAGTLRIETTRTVVEGKPTASRPKTAAGLRSIPIDARLVALLRAHRRRQAAEKLAAGPAYEDSGFLLADELGRPYHPESISGWFDTKVAEVGLPRIRLHDTRHTAATLMLAAGTPVKVVSEMLGHSSPTVTLGIYAHVLPGMAEEAGARLSAALLS